MKSLYQRATREMYFDFLPDWLNLPQGGQRRSPTLVAVKYQIKRWMSKQHQSGQDQPADFAFRLKRRGLIFTMHSNQLKSEFHKTVLDQIWAP